MYRAVEEMEAEVTTDRCPQFGTLLLIKQTTSLLDIRLVFFCNGYVPEGNGEP
jgi:hypothetical protein